MYLVSNDLQGQLNLIKYWCGFKEHYYSAALSSWVCGHEDAGSETDH